MLSTADFIPLAVPLSASSPFAPANAPPAKVRGTTIEPVTPKTPTVATTSTTAPNLFLAVKSLNKHSVVTSETIS